mgnify:CR=1 FL=1
MFYPTRFAGALATAALALGPHIAAAQNPEAETIENIYVSGTRSESPQMPVASHLSVLSREQIRLSGVQQLPELLRGLPGVQLQDADGSGGRNVSVTMRGFSANAANNVLVLVDGRKLNNPTLASPALNTVAVDDIERIEVIQGSAGVLYGDQAVAGVINIITREPETNRPRGSLEATAASLDTQMLSANLSQQFENGFGYRISARRRESDNFRDNNRSENDNLLLNLEYRNERGEAFVEYQHIDDDLRLPGALPDEQAAQDRKQTNNPDDFSNQETDLLRLGGRFTLMPGWQLLGEYSRREEDTDIFLFSASRQELEMDTFTPRLVGHWQTAAGRQASLTLGYDGVRSEFVQDNPFSPADADQDLDAVYAQMIYPLTQALTANLGARYSEVDDQNRLSGEGHNDSVEAGELGLNYQLTDSIKLYGRWAEAFRFASLDENALTLADVDFLKPQESGSFELGARGAAGDLDWQLSFYYMDIDGELAFDAGVANPASFSGRGANVNLPDSERQGLLVEAQWTFNEQWQLKGNYTYTDAQAESGSFAGNDTPFVADHTANLVLNYRPIESVTIYLDANYTGPRFRSGDDANQEGKLGSFTLVNANINWTWSGWDLAFRVKNLTDREFSDLALTFAPGMNVTYPRPDRTYSGSIRYRF